MFSNSFIIVAAAAVSAAGFGQIAVNVSRTEPAEVEAELAPQMLAWLLIRSFDVYIEEEKEHLFPL